jgi:hypothetical protein
VCAVSEVLCSISDGHYTESGNSLVSDEEKGRHAHEMLVSYLRRIETRPRSAHLLSEERGDTLTKHVSYISETHVSFLLNMHKKRISTEYSPRDAPCANTQYARWLTYANVCVLMGIMWAQCKKHHVEHKSDIIEAIRPSWV